ncbi:MAG: MarR family transcriptional regulator [Betaproteobacteria bacterium]
MPRSRHQATAELVDVVNLVTQMFWADLRQSDQPIELTQWATLRRISRSPCTMSELARHKGVGLPTISKSIEMLVRKGWVERWIDKTDRRQTLVRLTADGRKVLADSRDHLEDLLDQRLSKLTLAERDSLVAQFHRVREVLSPIGEV